MADLGTITAVLEGELKGVGVYPSQMTPGHRLDEPGLIMTTYLNFLPSGELELIMYTKVLGVLTPNIPVALYLRETKKLVKVEISDGNSKVKFLGLAGGSEKYFAVAFTELDFNALVFDKLTAA